MEELQPASSLPAWLVTWGPASVSLAALRRPEPAAPAEEAGWGWPGLAPSLLRTRLPPGGHYGALQGLRVPPPATF